jgi:hypothetical protein
MERVPGSTSTSVTWNDINTDDVSTAGAALFWAIEIKKAAPAAAVLTQTPVKDVAVGDNSTFLVRSRVPLVANVDDVAVGDPTVTPLVRGRTLTCSVKNIAVDDISTAFHSIGLRRLRLRM